MALTAGIQERDAWLMTPGKIASLFCMRQRYDYMLHGFVKTKKKPKGSDWD